MQYSFDVQEAIEHGVDEAIMIWNLRFWILKNKANNKHFHDDKTWTYNTTDAFAKLFPFWKPLKIWRLLDSMVERKILIKGNFNQNKHDRTCWYAFFDEQKMLAPHLMIAHFSEMKNGNFNNEKSISQKEKMEMVKMKNGDGKNEKCNTDIKTNDKPSSSFESLEEAKKFAEEEELKIDVDFWWKVSRANNVKNDKSAMLAWAKNPKNQISAGDKTSPAESNFKIPPLFEKKRAMGRVLYLNPDEIEKKAGKLIETDDGFELIPVEDFDVEKWREALEKIRVKIKNPTSLKV